MNLIKMMLALMMSAMLSLTVAACETTPPDNPQEAANTIILDEQAATTINLAYTAAAKAAVIAIETGVVTDTETVRRIGQLNAKAYAAVGAANAAYDAGNSDSYMAAIAEARSAITAIMDLITKSSPDLGDAPPTSG